MKTLFVEVEKCLGCKSCELACAVKHSSSRSLYSAIVGAYRDTPLPRISVEATTYGPFPLRCRHCDDPPCVDACITGAIQHNKDKRIIYSDESKCIGCFMCVMVCPFGAIIPYKKVGTNSICAYKCNLCKDEEEPVCVSACPTDALVYCEPEELVRNKRLFASLRMTGRVNAKK